MAGKISRSLICLWLALGALAAQTTPRPSPPLTIKLPGGGAVQLSSYRGKPVALVFVSTTCPHCQELTRELVPMAKEYGSRVQFLECAVNDSAEKALPGFIQQYRPSFPVGFTDQLMVNDYLQRSIAQVFYVPRIVLLDRGGVIQGDYPGESEFVKNGAANIRAELERMLKPPAAGKTSAAKKK
jgi:thiol-disulfide isomerase/thioredoxin